MKPLSKKSPFPETGGSYQEFCDKLTLAIADLKERLRSRYERHCPGQTALIHHALEEAESVAWCTPFPHLFLPELAEARIAQFARSA